MAKLEITSTKNPKVKQILHLRNAKERKKTNLFLIEGYRELLRSLFSSHEIKQLFICPSFFLKNNEKDLIKKIEDKGSEIILCSKSVFQRISYRDRPDGLLAIAKQSKPLSLLHLLNIIKSKKKPLFVIAEGIEKPGNLGTILRSCDGVKVDGVIITDPKTDIFNPNVVRASIGTLFTQPIFSFSIDEILPLFIKEKVALIATSPDAEKIYTHVYLKRAVALIIGSEQYGLSGKWFEIASETVKIPMLGIADSLNVATATTILLYEVLRQRSK